MGSNNNNDSLSVIIIKKLVAIIIIVIALLFATNAAWLLAFLSFDYEYTYVEQEGSDEADINAMISGGDINNGTTADSTYNSEEEQRQDQGNEGS